MPSNSTLLVLLLGSLNNVKIRLKGGACDEPSGLHEKTFKGATLDKVINMQASSTSLCYRSILLLTTSETSANVEKLKLFWS